jgi:hypothetical protein
MAATRQSQFRLGDEAEAQLERLKAEFTRRNGGARLSRTELVRLAIRRLAEQELSGRSKKSRQSV